MALAEEREDAAPKAPFVLGLRLRLDRDGREPFRSPVLENDLAGPGVDVVAAQDLRLDGGGEVFGITFLGERLGALDAVRIAVADLPRVTLLAVCALAFDLDDVCRQRS